MERGVPPAAYPPTNELQRHLAVELMEKLSDLGETLHDMAPDFAQREPMPRSDLRVTPHL